MYLPEEETELANVKVDNEDDREEGNASDDGTGVFTTIEQPDEQPEGFDPYNSGSYRWPKKPG